MSRVLRCNYGRYKIDVIVDDEDKCNLIDVLNDMVDEAKKKGYKLPRFPSLSYVNKMKHWYLNTDGDLMNMFEVIKENIITIWVGELDSPNDIWKSAMQLRNSKTSEDCCGESSVSVKAPPPPVREKLPIRRPLTRSSNLSPCRRSIGNSGQLRDHDSSPTRTTPTLITPPLSPVLEASPLRRSPRFVSHVSSPNLQHTLPSQDLVPSPTIGTSKTTTKKSSENSFIMRNEDIGCHGKKSLCWYNDKRMPKTTLARLAKQGIVISESTGRQEGQSVGPKGRGCRVIVPRRTESQSEWTVSDSEGSDYEENGENESSTDGELSEDALTDEELSDDDIGMIDDGYEPDAGFRFEDTVDGDEYFDKLFKNGEMYSQQEKGSIRLKAWMLFADKKHFKNVFIEYCIQEGFSVVVNKVDPKRYTAQCAANGCPFRIHASVLPDGHTFAIKCITTDHNCIRMKQMNPMASTKWCAHKVVDYLRTNNDTSLEALNDYLLKEVGIKLKRSSGYNMRAYALSLIHGGHDESYAKLPAYCEVIKEINPESIAHCVWVASEEPERPLVFKNIFISFAAEIRGFLVGCRGLVGVDGCHLKGNYGGVLLSAVALDGNNEIFPLAHGIYDSENKSSWSSFMHHLKGILTSCDRDDWTIISDRQKGILPALDDIWLTVTRRFCARNLLKNFKKDFPGPLMHVLFWRVVNAYSESAFKKALRIIGEHGGAGAVKWFTDIGGPEYWAKYKIQPFLCQDEVTTNFVEAFNAILGSDRSKPVLTLLEGIRRTTMVRHCKRHDIAEGWDENDICPKVMARLVNITKDSKSCKVYNAGYGQFEIKDGISYVPVSLESRTCTCGRWQISGIPCKHAVRAMIHLDLNPEKYVHEWYSVKKYKETYSGIIQPIGDSETWQEYNVPQLQPPPLKRSIGRPSKNRRREEGEPQKGKRSTTVKCKKCSSFGHNARTCKGGLTAKETRAQGGIVVEKHAKKRKQTSGTSSSQPDPVTHIKSAAGIVTSTQPGPLTRSKIRKI